MSFVSDFKEFAMKGNVIDLAVGVIIGAAFGKIVDSAVNDLIMPVIGRIVGKVDVSNLFIPLSEVPAGVPPTLDALRKAGVPAELHIYQKGDHGVGLAPGDPVLSTWTDRLLAWLHSNGFVESR